MKHLDALEEAKILQYYLSKKVKKLKENFLVD